MIGKKINQLATELAPASTDLTIIGNPTTGVSKKITLAQLGAIFSGAVSFYTNYAAFPTPGTTDVIFCAKDTQKLYLWSGSAYVEVFPSQALLDTYQLRSEKGVSNGYASLDSSGKVPISQLPSSIMEYKGTWSAATNTPTLANGTGDTGDVYLCNAAGTVNFGAGPLTFAVGDYVVYSGTIWQRSSGAVGTVTSVAASITGNAIGITGSPVTTSGTLALAFAGTSSQYINGAGNLTTFPTLTGYVPYTGATTNVDLGEYEIKAGQFTLDVSPTGTAAVGTTRWNNTIGSSETTLKGGSVILKNGVDLVARVVNKVTPNTTLTKATYPAVKVSGAAGQRLAVDYARANNDINSADTIGLVCETIATNQEGFIITVGQLLEIDTTGSLQSETWADGDVLYLSPTTPGALTNIKPTGATGHIVVMGYVEYAHAIHGSIYVKVMNGWELDELHNVYISSVANNDGLFYESSTSLWKNKSIATILGYTPQAQLNGTGFVKASGTTISYDNSTYVTTDTFQTISASKTFGAGFSIASAGGTNQLTSFINTNSIHSGSAGTNVFGFNNSNNIYFGKGLSNGGVITYNNSAVRFYALPDADGTIALVGGSGVGTVTSVGLSSATSGVTIGSTPITTSGTITLAIATASGSQQGLLSSTDWTTFNNKQSALTNPVTGTGTTNYLPKFTGTSTIGNSLVYDNGTAVAIGGTTMNVTGLNVQTSGANLTGTTAYVNINAAVSGYGLSIGGDGTRQAGVISGYQGIDFYTYNGGWTRSLTLNYVGNLGLGVTPSAWQSFTGLQFGAVGSIASNDFGGGNIQTFIGNNVYYDNAGFKYIKAGNAYMMRMTTESFQWNIAGSGTINGAISFTQAMTLNASGNLSIGNTNDTYKLDVSGTGRFSGLISGYSYLYGLQFYKVGLQGASGYLRWDLETTGTESGSNAGSDLILYRYDDAGSYLGTAFSITRSTGAATFSSSVTATQGRFINAASNFPLTIDNSTQGYVAQEFKSNGVSFGYIGNANTLNSGGSVTDMVVRSENALILSSNAAEKMRITSGGNVGIGITSPSTKLDVVGSDGIRTSTDQSTSAFIGLAGSASEGRITVSSYGGYQPMTFYTGGSERMRITSGGALLVGTTSELQSATSKLNIAGDFYNANGVSLKTTNGGSGSQFVGFINESGTLIGSINRVTTTNAVAYNTTSDYRLKEDLKSINGLEIVNKIKVYDYKWKSDNSRMDGVLAHELAEVLPYAVTGIKDGEKMQQVDYSKIVPVLIQSVKELKAELDTLKNK